jgi:hypothetical protein
MTELIEIYKKNPNVLKWFEKVSNTFYGEALAEQNMARHKLVED